ncbi:MAG: TetR/AcrR family transcriptional regulator [Oscillospiraceae bacterium]|nr:TetR/AcrR family transcriptional regulator [Oscillospiraceae bacterium]
MSVREIPTIIHDKETQNRILDSATRLFAVRGFTTVSMNDIADDVGIKAASIYHHYKSKEAILKDVLYRFEKGYRNYFDSLNYMNKDVNALDDLMDNLFNKEFVEMLDPIGCFGMSLVLNEQHRNESARELSFELFHKYSVKTMKSSFDSLVQKGVIPPSDTGIIAAFFMHSVFAMNEIHIHEYVGTAIPLDCKAVYADLKCFITAALTKGV